MTRCELREAGNNLDRFLGVPGMGVVYRVQVPNTERSSKCSQEARVSTARENPKEAGGKPPARGTRTPSEAIGSWMSLPNKAKSILLKADCSIWGG
jgi:hypothetical protein